MFIEKRNRVGNGNRNEGKAEAPCSEYIYLGITFIIAKGSSAVAAAFADQNTKSAFKVLRIFIVGLFLYKWGRRNYTPRHYIGCFLATIAMIILNWNDVFNNNYFKIDTSSFKQIRLCAYITF